jgi:peptidoglycan/xylan/chitin deacetylase (PgdA/CDA1 family)
LAAGGFGALALGAITFTLVRMLIGHEQAASAMPPTIVEPEMVTGAVAPRPAAPQAEPVPPVASPPPVAAPSSVCKNPNALGLSRVVEIDTAGGPGFGFEQYKAHDFLEMGEVVLTFDDGPWPNNTRAVLAALAAQCVKATFFAIGKHATWHSEILKQVVAEGHTVGSHTWSHTDLTKKTFNDAKDEIENGISAVVAAAGSPLAPFFRFPALRQSAELTAYLGERNIAMFSTDLDSFDFKTRKPEQVVVSVMTKLKKQGKGIVLMHDFQHSTAVALPELLTQLKAGGYKVVHLKAKDRVVTLPQYDAAMVPKARTGQTVDARPTASVVRTISSPKN